MEHQDLSHIGKIAEQITDIYLEKEDWHEKKLSRDEAIKYHKRLIEKGAIAYEAKGDKVVGYMEVWRINAKQLNRIKHHEPFSAVTEDVNKGTIGFLANVWIDEKYRNNEVAKDFKKIWDDKTHNCNLLAGMKRNKELRIHRNTGV
jgi:hypothetical protein